MNQAELRTLLDYHYWARDRIVAAVEALTPEQFTKDLGSSFPSVRDTLAHMVGAETAWLSRWQGESPSALLPASQFPDAATVKKTWLALEKKLRTYFQQLREPGMQKVIAYKALNGMSHAAPFWQMLQHVVNHASYHRGQVVTMLRQLGAQPPKSVDLIAFYREKAK
jgi:uncharacterized damage-inducible protein DinB